MTNFFIITIQCSASQCRIRARDPHQRKSLICGFPKLSLKWIRNWRVACFTMELRTTSIFCTRRLYSRSRIYGALTFLVTPHMDLPIVPVHIGVCCHPVRQLGGVINWPYIRQFVNDSYTGKWRSRERKYLRRCRGPTMGSVDTAFEMEFLDY
jgi:hypothetical protein